eukprot:2125312-Ditylum_brightwellii.AAC.1
MDEPSHKTALDVPEKMMAVQERVPPQQHTRSHQTDITSENYRTVHKARCFKSSGSVFFQTPLGRMGKQIHNTNDFVDPEECPLHKVLP